MERLGVQERGIGRPGAECPVRWEEALGARWGDLHLKVTIS